MYAYSTNNTVHSHSGDEQSTEGRRKHESSRPLGRLTVMLSDSVKYVYVCLNSNIFSQHLMMHHPDTDYRNLIVTVKNYSEKFSD